MHEFKPGIKVRPHAQNLKEDKENMLELTGTEKSFLNRIPIA